MIEQLEKEGYVYIGFMKTQEHVFPKNFYHYVFLENKKLDKRRL